MRYLNDAQVELLKEYRRILNKHIASVVEDPAGINDCMAAIPMWKPGRAYARYDVRIDPADGTPYWAMHDHSSVEGQELQPSLSPTVWTHYHGTSAETARPFLQEGHNPYMTGHYCIEGTVIARAKQDNVVYPPSVLPEAWEIVNGD